MAKGVNTDRRPRSGMAFGRDRGHKVNVIKKKDRRERPSRRKGRLGQRTAFVRSVIKEICGFAPYEKRMIEILKSGGPKDTKKAYRFAKKRLGTHKRAMRKRAEMDKIIREEA